MAYHVQYTACPFKRTIKESESALRRERAHIDECGNHHIVDIKLVE